MEKRKKYNNRNIIIVQKEKSMALKSINSALPLTAST